MDKELLEKAISLEYKLRNLKEHKDKLISCNTQFRGDLVLHCAQCRQEILLYRELYGDTDFFNKYLENLDAKIIEIEKQFSEL